MRRSAAGAERRADRELAASAERSRQHEIRDVDADDQQHETDGAEQHEQRRAHVADERARAARGRQIRALRLVLGNASASRARDRAHLLARLLERHARLQPPDHVEVMRAALRRRVSSAVKRSGSQSSDSSGYAKPRGITPTTRVRGAVER